MNFSVKLDDYNLDGMDQSWNSSLVSSPLVDAIDQSWNSPLVPSPIVDGINQLSGNHRSLLPSPVDIEDIGDTEDIVCIPMTQLDGPTDRKRESRTNLLVILLTLNAREALFGAIIGHAEFAKMTSPPTQNFKKKLTTFFLNLYFY